MAVVDTSAGFRYAGKLGNPSAPPTVQRFYFKDTESLYKGDMVNVESGEVDLAATGDTAIIGIAMESKAGTDSTTQIDVIVDPDAVYAVYDANARTVGTLLDLSGSAGAQTVTTSSNGNFVVVANSAADELTQVMITGTAHPLK
ncbi:MAG: hypothetical protein L6Q98_08405 [Anaerolineae bacterium]|nr:hypothetical protein [Anaerolineae bacterium]NUQ02610.1 hypothetical protein [Anaerolineae bacterium]